MMAGTTIHTYKTALRKACAVYIIRGTCDLLPDSRQRRGATGLDNQRALPLHRAAFEDAETRA
jgi:hypothetical protein